jgi:hypothetical protein
MGENPAPLNPPVRVRESPEYEFALSKKAVRKKESVGPLVQKHSGAFK